MTDGSGSTIWESTGRTVPKTSWQRETIPSQPWALPLPQLQIPNPSLALQASEIFALIGDLDLRGFDEVSA